MRAHSLALRTRLIHDNAEGPQIARFSVAADDGNSQALIWNSGAMPKPNCNAYSLAIRYQM